MKTISYYKKKGFVHYADIVLSDTYAQGVDVVFPNEDLLLETKAQRTPAVYVMADGEDVIKIGESSHIFQRVAINYKSTSNSTNNFVRESIRKIFKTVQIYVFFPGIVEESMIGFNFQINRQKGLEEAMLHAYLEKYNELPSLNRQRN